VVDEKNYFFGTKTGLVTYDITFLRTENRGQSFTMPQASPGDNEKEETTDYTDYKDFFVFSSCLFMLHCNFVVNFLVIFIGDNFF